MSSNVTLRIGGIPVDPDQQSNTPEDQQPIPDQGTDAGAEQEQRQVLRVKVGGGVKYDASTGDVVPSSGFARGRQHLDGSQFNEAQAGILSTARGYLGGPAKMDGPPEKVIVEHGGMQMTLRQAENAGLVKRNEAGVYVEASEQEQQKALTIAGDSSMRHQGEAMREEPFHPDHEAAIAAVLKGVDQEIIGKVLIPLLAESARGKHVSAADVVSRSDGAMTPERAQHFLTFATAAFEAQATHEMGKLLPAASHAECQQWLAQNKPAQYKAARVAHVTGRTLEPLRSLVREFLKAVPPSEEALKAAGAHTRVDPTTGELLVWVDSHWESVRSAARRGRI